MAKSLKNKKKQHSRSTSPQVNAPMQRTPSGPTQCTSRVVEAISTGVWQLVSSGSKALTGRRNQSQNSNAMVQQDDASTIVSASSVNAPNDPNSGTNATLVEHGAMDPNALLLSELGSPAPRFGTNMVLGGLNPTQNITATGINPSAPPRLNTSDANEASSVGMGPSNVQGATTTASNTSVVGTLIDVPSPRQNTQSAETHKLQQTLRGSASEQVRMHGPAQDGWDGASAFSAPGANNTPTIVETVQEGNSEDSLEEVDLRDDVRVDLHNNTGSGYDSGLQGLAINTNDPGQANFVMSIGALGNASGTQLDGSQDVSFDESTVARRSTIRMIRMQSIQQLWIRK